MSNKSLITTKLKVCIIFALHYTKTKTAFPKDKPGLSAFKMVESIFCWDEELV